MKISKIQIKNAFGIEEKVIEPGDITALKGSNGAGKTSVLHSIQTALSNKSPRTNIIKEGTEEAVLYVELDDGSTIKRKKRLEKSDYTKITAENQTESYLKSLFDETQFNPLKFMDLSLKEQNKVLLSLVEDNTTEQDFLDWFGEVPNTTCLKDRHILSKLDYLQSKTSPWYVERHDVNKRAYHTKSTAEDLISDVPVEIMEDGKKVQRFNVDKWKKVDLSEEYGEIEKKQTVNSQIDKAKEFIDDNEVSIENINNKYDLEVKEIKEFNGFKRDKIENNIKEELKELDIKLDDISNQIKLLQEEWNKINNQHINIRNNALEERSKEIDTIEREKIAGIEKVRKMNLEEQQDKFTFAKKYVKDNKKTDLEEIKEEAKYKEKMKALVSNYEKAVEYFYNIEELNNKSAELTRKIELARDLPCKLLEEAKLPIAGMKLENGVVKILNNNDSYVPVDNLSEGEKLQLCIDIAKAKCGELKVILVDGFEKLDENKQKLFIEKAKKSELQYFITKVGVGELEITEY